MDKLSASEALYGFLGESASQDESITIGASHDCAIWAEKIDEFCKKHDLSPPREYWHRRLKVNKKINEAV